MGRREHFAGGTTRKDKVEKAFGRMDKMLRISSSFRSCVNYMTTNNMLGSQIAINVGSRWNRVEQKVLSILKDREDTPVELALPVKV